MGCAQLSDCLHARTKPKIEAEIGYIVSEADIINPLQNMPQTCAYKCHCLWLLYTNFTSTINNIIIGSDLSPPEVVYVCRGGRVSLSCVTNASFLEWNITAHNYIGLKLISYVGSIDPLTVNYTTFTFTRESQQPLNVTMTIVNATVDYRVVCQSVPAGATNQLQKTVRIIRDTNIASIS